MHARHTNSSRSRIGGLGRRDGASGNFATGWGQCRLPESVWQLATAKDHGPHPFASHRPLKTPTLPVLGLTTRECLAAHPYAGREFLADWVAPGCADSAMIDV